MLLNNIKAIARNLYRESSYSMINIAGLSIGTACCITLALYLQNELAYDQHFAKHKRIFRVVSELNASGNVNLSAQTAYGLGPLLARDNSMIEQFVRVNTPRTGYSLFRFEDIAFRWDDVVIADPSLFKVFDHDIIYGTIEALNSPSAIAISESFSKKYFGDINSIGQILRGDAADYQVKLVFADLPDNTHLKYEAVVSYLEKPVELVEPVISERLRHDLWYAKTDFTYLLMPADFNPQQFARISDVFFEKYMESYEDSYDSSVRFLLEPLADIHLKSVAQRDRPRGSIFYIYAFTGIALFVLAVACINYVNLSTARFAKRGKEVAIRKILGASRGHLIIQFLIESVFFSVIALLLALMIVYFVLKFTTLGDLFGKTMSLAPLATPSIGVLLLLLTVTVGLIAGLYPAFHLSSTTSTSALRGKNARVRQALVFLQFLVSICVIASTFIMYQQMKFIQEKPLGFKKENKIMMQVSGADSIEKIPLFVEQLKQNSSILGVSASRGRIGGAMGFAQAEVENEEGSYDTQSYNWFFVDDEYVDVTGIEIIEGRNFEPETRGDIGKAVLVNETLVRKMGWTDPIGKGIRYEEGRTIYVIGVMKDFHFQGLQHEVESIVFWLSAPPNFSTLDNRTRSLQSRILTVSLSDSQIFETLEYVETKWQAFDPAHPFEFQFLDEYLDDMYTSDLRQMKLVGLFAGLCIFISCLGLFGLTAFAIEQRTKEIGVRKVLGASDWQIATLLFKSVLWVVLGAAVLASAIAFWVMNRWLLGFYYHGEINPVVFLVSAFLALCIAFLTMATQTLRIARANPVRALRYE
jgi:putative ABC transport system permease protein